MSVTARESKAARRKRRVRNTILIVAIVLLLLIAAMFFVQRKVREQFASSGESEVTSAQVTTGSISTTVSGSGSLASVDLVDVTVPDGVELDTVYAELGDDVAEGDMLASVNISTVLSALSDVQSEMNELDEKLEDASEDEVSSKVTAGVSGRVKAIFAKKGDDVSQVVYENGALLLLSLDGYMAADIEATAYSVGDTVTLIDSDGEEYEGTVSSVTGSKTVVLVTDNGTTYNDTVTVDGAYTGTLYVHEPLKVTGYAGTVSKVNVSENTKVSSSTTLFTLTDTSYSANYDQILVERSELEDTYQTLVKLYMDGGVLAPITGTIESITDEDSTTSTDDENIILTIDPNEQMSVSISVDETDILSLEVGQDATVTIESIGDDTYIGTVTEIDKTATSSDGVTIYTATITLDKADGMLAGMTASAAITIEGVENALLVPEDAVRKTSSTAYVYTSYDETTGELGDMVEVTVGLSNGTYTEIISGLSEGDTVYYTESENTFSFTFGGGMSGGNFGGGDITAGGDFNANGDFDVGRGGGSMPDGMSIPN